MVKKKVAVCISQQPAPVNNNKLKKKKKKERPPPFPVVRLVAFFALLIACVYGGVAAVSITSGQTLCATKPSECHKLTDLQAMALFVLLHGLVRCSVAQAIVAGTTLLLRRSGRALAFVTLAVFVPNHGLFTGLIVLVSVATPTDVILNVVCGGYVVVAAVLALICFISLLRGAEDTWK